MFSRFGVDRREATTLTFVEEFKSVKNNTTKASVMRPMRINFVLAIKLFVKDVITLKHVRPETKKNQIHMIIVDFRNQPIADMVLSRNESLKKTIKQKYFPLILEPFKHI